MKLLLYILLAFACLGTRAQETFSISGTVNDEKGLPLPGATVFITNSKYIQPTNNEGKFSFSYLRPGTYEVVIKMLGYTPLIKNITLHQKSIELIVQLQESATALKTVTIKGASSVPYWETNEYLRRFMANFIGETVNAEQCTLINPEALNFHYDKGGDILRANADEFLVVENKALGYRIKYLLTEFKLYMNTGVCNITGSPYFEELKGTAAQQTKWAENRRLAYLGSSRHFFSSVFNNAVKKEGFLIYKIIVDPQKKLGMIGKKPTFSFFQVNGAHVYTAPVPLDTNARRALTAVLVDDPVSIFSTINNAFKTMATGDTINGPGTIRLGFFVIYTGADQSPLFYKTGTPLNVPPGILGLSKQQWDHAQVSRIVPKADVVTIDRNYEWPGTGFSYYGYWSWLRIADLMPLDYVIDPLSQTKTK